MTLDVSPDLDALTCYLIVLGVGALAALFQLYQKLGGFRGAWVMLETWALFAVYASVPVALFWLLDRTNAIHDTALFAAIIVGVGYQQILSGQLSSIKAPEEMSGFWQLFSAWADRMAARVRDRIQRNSTRFRDFVIASVVEKSDRFEQLKQLAMVGTTDSAQLSNQLSVISARAMELGERGWAEKQARILYDAAASVDDFTHQLKDRKVISRLAYYWYGQEWRSKTAALVTAILLASIAVGGVLKFRTVGMELRYYLWRLSKVNATSADRFRTRNALLALLAECPDSGYESLARLMTRDDVSVEIITQSTNLLIESASSSPSWGAKLPLVLVRSLWNANPDARGRIENALVYLAKAQKIAIPKDLESWRPSAQDSAEIIDTKIKLWQGLLKSSRSNPPL